jgi:AcrR family transcriptional regulator
MMIVIVKGGSVASDTRDRMIDGAVRLLATRGLQETSFSEVIELTGAPRGSIYHHFPDGKDQLVAEAVDLAGARSTALIESWSGASATEIAERFLDGWRRLLTYAGFRAGCSVVAVTVATDSPALLDHVGTVFATWRSRIADALRLAGVSDDDADGFAAMLVAASEGAVVLARAERSLDPFELVAARLVADARSLTSA